MVLGMKSATSNNSCIYCTGHKEDRSNLSKSIDFYTSLKRSYGPNWKKDPGCHEDPLFTIPLKRIIIDELHLLLRITDRLEEGIINDAMLWDQADNVGRPRSQFSTSHVDQLVAAIRSCGISFAIWTKENKTEWTSLMGNEKKKLLHDLPNKMKDFVNPQHMEAIHSLWLNFESLYQVMTNNCPSREQIANFHDMAKEWGQQLISMPGSAYDKTCPITPYMHIMIYHVPDILKAEGSLKLFTGQGVEKKNDDFRRYFHRSINKWDSCKAMICVEKRQEELGDLSRKKRVYEKQSQDYWFGGGKSAVANKIQRLEKQNNNQASIQQPNLQPSYTIEALRKLTVAQLKEVMKELNLAVTSRKPRKPDLIQMIYEAQQ